MPKFIPPTLIILALILGGWYLVSRGIDRAPTLDKAPDFALRDFEGNTVQLADFAGKNLVLNSWAVWCPFCVEELKDFARVQREFGDQITIVSINRAESLEKQKEFLGDLAVTVTDDLVFLLDPKDSFYQSIGGFSMPETLFVNENGEIILHKRGPLDYNQMKKTIQELYDI